MKILIPEFVAQTGKDYLRECGYEVCDDRIDNKDEFLKRIDQYDGLLVRALPCDEEVMKVAKRLKVISKHGVGYDNIDVDCCTRYGVQVTYTPEAVCGAVAEHALYLMFACAKNTRYTIRQFVENGDFDARDKKLGVELEGSVAGILGLGRIGRSLAQKCVGLGMKVIGYDPYVSQEQLPSDIQWMDRDSVIKNSDFLSLNLLCNSETIGSFGMSEFEMMKNTAYFINVSRGAVVQEAALIEALQRNIILGAGIDVYEQEPPNPENPLFRMDNVMATPHQAGSTTETYNKVSLHAAIGIHEALSGKTPSWPLNSVVRK